MKLISLTLIFMIVTSLNQCHEQHDIVKVRYEAYTRGSDYSIEIDRDQIEVRSGLRGTVVNQRPLSPEEWEAVREEISKIALEELSTIEPDAEKRFSDAAAHARVKVITQEAVFESPEFDDGNPPKALQPLVKAMITLAETVE